MFGKAPAIIAMGILSTGVIGSAATDEERAAKRIRWEKEMEKAQQLLKIKNNATPGEKPYGVGKILHQDSFATLNNWVVEQMPGGTTKVVNGSLDVNDKKGCTIWYRHKLDAPVMIEYSVTLKPDVPPSNMNCFWMASDPKCDSLFRNNGPKRTGSFGNYNELKLYYVGCGGFKNTRTRFRRYVGLRPRPMLEAHDLSDKRFLLKSGATYKIQLVMFGKRVQYFRDGACFYDITDDDPLACGHFAFRLVHSHQVFSKFKVYRLRQR